MNTVEFSNEFDTQLNAYFIDSPFGKQGLPISLEFDEYEKSVFLTKAQEIFVSGAYMNKGQYNYEKSEYFRRLLNYLDVEKELECNGIKATFGVEYLFRLPKDVMFITFEQAKFKENKRCPNKTFVPIIPVRQDDIHKLLKNPFRGPSQDRVLRTDRGDGVIGLFSILELDKYILRYIRIPSPIILEDLPEELSINSINKKSECELNEIFHRYILDLAIEQAFQSRLTAAKVVSQAQPKQ